MSLPFKPVERQEIEKEFDRLIELIEQTGKRVDRVDMMKQHHRFVLEALRVSTGQRLTHSAVAPLLLGWARDAGDIRLYAQRIVSVYARSLQVDIGAEIDNLAISGDFIAMASKRINASR